MLIDALLSFVAPGAPLSLVGSTGASFTSNVLDLLGQGVGTAPQNIIGNAATFGMDLGIGSQRLLLDIAIGTALTTGDSATLTVALQAAADQGSGGNYQPSTWDTLVQSPAITAAQGVAFARIARFDWPPAFPENLNPRYMRLLFSTPSGTQFTAGTVGFAVVTPIRDDYSVANQARNYTVS